MKLQKMLCAVLLSSAPLSIAAITETAMAHEKAFPTKQLKTLTPEGLDLSFKESGIKPDQSRLSAFEKKHALVLGKGDLAGNVFLGSDKDKKVKVVAVFLDGKSDRGETEFGATVDTSGKISKAAVFSSPESGDATAAEFLASLQGKGAEELEAMKKSIPDTERSKKFIVELAQKAIGRVESSFGRK